MIRALQNALRRLLPHEHTFYLDDLSQRDETGMVSCTCSRCNERFTAEYGLALPGKWIGWRAAITPTRATKESEQSDG